ncbi:MAG: radical SAM protein [Deltaproteobacteria bacterium]|nr:radical SAM protein [Deltaproteobacteria bacterium]
MKDRKAGIAPGIVLKQTARVASHPWIWTKLAKLQGEKWLFDLLYPRAHNGKAGKIRQISFRITDRCNLRCSTCGQWGENGFLHHRDLSQLKNEEVPAGRYLDVLSDLVSRGHRPLVYFWGGEPMLYNGLPDLIEASASLGLPASIATNGTRLADIAEHLVKAPLFLCQVSIDGHSAELHNRLRPSMAGAMHNFEDIEEGLEVLNAVRSKRNKSLPVIASLTVISKENLNHLVSIYETFKNRVDLFVFYLSWWIGPNEAKAHETDFYDRFGYLPTRHRGWIGGWKPENYQALDRQIRALLARSRPLDATPVTIIPHVTGPSNLERYYTDHSHRFGFDKCISIYQAVEINSNGDISPCRDYHDYVVGNIKEDNITDLWNSAAYTRFRKSITTKGLMPVCSRCCGLMGY